MLMTQAEAEIARIAQAQGLAYHISYDEIFEVCRNTPAAVEVLTQACEGLPFELSETPQRFSEDFGQFAQTAQAAMFWLGAGEDHPQLHNPDYDFPDALIPVGTGIFWRALSAKLAIPATS